MFANGNTATDGTQTQDTIVLPEGTYLLTIEGADETFEPVSDPGEAPAVTNAPDASMGDLDLTESVIIQGAGSALTVIQWDDAAETKDRIFHIYNPTEDVFAELSGLSVSNGLLTAELLGEGPPSNLGDLPTEWLGMRAGAGIAMGPAATAVLNDPNKEGGADSAQGGDGGSQRPDDPADETGGSYALTLSDVQISDNTTDGDGGGLYNAGPVTANEIVVARNTSGKNGGGIYNEGDSLIERSTIEDNAAEGGGGMFVTGNPATSLRVNSTTFSGNTAVGGGAISGRVVKIYLTNCTISGNAGSDVGGGVYSNGVVEVVNCSIVDNEATGAEAGGGAGINVFNSGKVSVTLVNTLLSGNVAGAENSRAANCGCTGSQSGCVDGMNRKIETLGYNLSDDASCNLDGEGDLDEVEDPGIGPLEDNGGPTLTHALLAGSQAIDAGDNDECPNNDQRGGIRPADGDENGTFICDIGAFEFFPGYTDLHINNLVAPDEVVRGDAVPIRVEAHNTGVDPVTLVVMTTTISEELSVVGATYNVNDGDPGACTEASGTVTCSIGTMAFDDLAAVNIETTATAVGAATIGTTVTSPDDADETNNSASATVDIRGIADMQLEASADEPAVTVGSQMTVTASVTNAGPDDATSVQVFTEVPIGTSFVSATSDAGSCTEADGQVVCELDNMVANGPSVEVVLVLTADDLGITDVTLSVGAYEFDPDVENNTGGVTVGIRGTADMQLEMTVDQLSVKVDSQVTLIASVTNNGPDGATSVQVTSQVPSGTTFVSATSDAGSCRETDGQVVCELDDMLANGPSVEIALVLTADEIGTIEATLVVGAYEADPDDANNTGSTEVTVNEKSSGCGSCTVSTRDSGGGMLLSIGVLSILMLRRRRFGTMS
jgi:uncharacterized repeat protein (TIGR01451 family)